VTAGSRRYRLREARAAAAAIKIAAKRDSEKMLPVASIAATAIGHGRAARNPQ